MVIKLLKKTLYMILYLFYSNVITEYRSMSQRPHASPALHTTAPREPKLLVQPVHLVPPTVTTHQGISYYGPHSALHEISSPPYSISHGMLLIIM